MKLGQVEGGLFFCINHARCFYDHIFRFLEPLKHRTCTPVIKFIELSKKVHTYEQIAFDIIPLAGIDEF